MNEEIKIVLNVDGLEKNLTNTKALKKEFQNLSNDAKKSLNEIEKEAKEAFGEIEKGSKGLSNRLGTVGRSISSKLGNVFKSFSAEGQKAFEDLAGAKGINDLASVLGSFGAAGAAAAIGIQAVSFAYTALTGETKKTIDQQEKFVEVNNTLNESLGKEINELDTLFNSLNDVNVVGEDRNKIIESIQSKYADYLGNIKLEKLGVNELTSAYALLKKEIIEKNVEQAFGDELAKEKANQIAQQRILIKEQQTLAGLPTFNLSEADKELRKLTELRISVAQLNFNESKKLEQELLKEKKKVTDELLRSEGITQDAIKSAEELRKSADNAAKSQQNAAKQSTQQTNAINSTIESYKKQISELDKSLSTAFNRGKLETANNLLGDRQRLIEQSVNELSKFGNSELVSKFIADLESQQIDFALNLAGFRKNLSGEIEKAFKDSYKTAVDAAIKSGDLSFETFEKISIEKSNDGLNTIVTNAENVATKLNSTFETSLIDVNGTAITFNEAIAKTLLDAGKLTQQEFDQIKNFAAQTNDAIVFAEKTAAEERSEIQQNFGKFLLDVLKKKTDKEIANLNSQKEIELATVGNNEEEKFRIQNEYAIKVAELRLKDAKDVQARGGDVINYIEELEAEILRLKNESNAKQKTSADKNAEDARRKEEEAEKKRKEGIQKTIDSSFDLLKNSIDLIDTFVSFGQEKIDKLGESISQIDAQIQESQERQREISAILNEEEGARFAAAAAALDFQKQREEELAAQKIALEQAKFAEEQKLARRRKAIAISEAVASAAQSLINIFAAPSIIPEPFNTAFKATQAASVVAVTTAQIAKISKEKFDVGGFTGDGEGKPDESGFKMAGIVHEGEWVAPKWMVESPRFAESIQRLESERVRGFANGGFTDFNANSNALTQSNQLAAAFEKYADASIKMANRPVIANASEFANVQKTQAKVLSLTTI